jgi:AcrR family transcriptional regulator
MYTVMGTRQAVIDAAVELFNNVGYAGVEVHDILKRAGITKGAFYNHFPTKEAVAFAIIAESDVRIEDAMSGAMLQPASTLENLIVATLVVTDMVQRDPMARIANLLRQTLIQADPAAPITLSPPLWSLTENIKAAIVDGDLLDDIDVDAVALTIRAAVLGLGTRLLSDTSAEDIFDRTAKIWQVILRGNVPPEKLPHFERFATRVAEQY